MEYFTPSKKPKVLGCGFQGGFGRSHQSEPTTNEKEILLEILDKIEGLLDWGKFSQLLSGNEGINLLKNI